MRAWDRRTLHTQRKLRDRLIHEQVRDGVGPFSPYWREKLHELRIPQDAIRSAHDLVRLPAIGERDVCPDGDPRGAARLVLQADEAGFAVHAAGPDLRKAIARRLLGPATYRRQVEAATRPTTYHWAGHSVEFPIASTRRDLDLIARAGNRAWRVLGLTSADILVSAVPVAPRLDHLFLSYAALAAGAPALFPRSPGDGVREVAAALALVPARVLALPVGEAVDLLAELAATDLDLSRLGAVLLVGHPTAEQRVDVAEALLAAGAGTPDVLVLAGPPEGRVLWAECRPGAVRGGTGLHTYPDLDFLELADPESGEQLAAVGGGELVLTQLGFRGSALLRWRTGDLVPGPIMTDPCPACRRRVPRLPAGIRPAALLPQVTLASRAVDLRAVSAALAGRNDIADWRIEIGRSERDGADQLLVLITPTVDDLAAAAVGVYRDIRALAGVRPTQVITVAPDRLANGDAGSVAVTSRIRDTRR
ncbi:MAG: hypothetical protein ABR520_01725 [Mycobacteriales bacterium]|nr:hypothetical protein [Frankia sp.]